jgi:GDPmannose 4,6-dehydratase
MKRVIIVGSAGQDGRILFEKLQNAGHHVLGISRQSTVSSDKTGQQNVDIRRLEQVLSVVQKWRPDEVYYVAAFHHSSQDTLSDDPLDLFDRSFAVHVTGLINFLDAIRQTNLPTRLFYASSCLVFGKTAGDVQDETTPFNPGCIYGITKMSGVHCCRFYRHTHGVFTAVGHLYNHESVYRSESFVSQKIIRAAIRISKNQQDALVLADLSARVDWGYAPDFVEAMERILALDQPDDFVIATGESHTVREFLEIAFKSVGLDWSNYVQINPSLTTRQRPLLIGNASRLRERTGWRPTVSFAQMIERLVTDQLHAV